MAGKLPREKAMLVKNRLGVFALSARQIAIISWTDRAQIVVYPAVPERRQNAAKSYSSTSNVCSAQHSARSCLAQHPSQWAQRGHLSKFVRCPENRYFRSLANSRREGTQFVFARGHQELQTCFQDDAGNYMLQVGPWRMNVPEHPTNPRDLVQAFLIVHGPSIERTHTRELLTQMAITSN